MTQMAPCYQNTLIASIIAARKGSFLAHKGNQIVAHSTLPYCTSKQMSGCPIAEKGVLLCNIMQIYNYVWKTRLHISVLHQLPFFQPAILLFFYPSILPYCAEIECICAEATIAHAPTCNRPFARKRKYFDCPRDVTSGCSPVLQKIGVRALR